MTSKTLSTSNLGQHRFQYQFWLNIVRALGCAALVGANDPPPKKANALIQALDTFDRRTGELTHQPEEHLGAPIWRHSLKHWSPSPPTGKPSNFISVAAQFGVSSYIKAKAAAVTGRLSLLQNSENLSLLEAAICGHVYYLFNSIGHGDIDMVYSFLLQETFRLEIGTLSALLGRLDTIRFLVDEGVKQHKHPSPNELLTRVDNNLELHISKLNHTRCPEISLSLAEVEKLLGFRGKIDRYKRRLGSKLQSVWSLAQPKQQEQAP
ncbi:hypothetical protein B0H67DRAFT_204901 [Lasiosphaeris hirsuta]|uniref:Uncharacterized protein n=1 Tax=Lasiosphaeris hirsuta TaxID=260670 RepID=A0AA40ART3_9PEZI|nr:hypothetical protein B0H67DRAFT_204901 [Lasiosphaeris hirsuta]